VGTQNAHQPKTNNEVQIMQDRIDVYRQKNHYLAVLKDAVKVFDGKVFNKRFTSHLEKFGITFSGGGYDNTFYVSDLPTTPVYGGKYILFIHSSTWNGDVVVDKRFNADNFIKIVDKQLQHNSEAIQQMEQNEKDKDKLITEYNDLVNRLEDLTRTMNYEFKDKYKYEFKDIVYKVRK